jgi:WD40-like Beta Propeller Repeat
VTPRTWRSGRNTPRINPLFLAGLLFFLPDIADAAGDSPPFAPPVFYFFSTIEASDYRPVLNADATVVIFERTFADRPNVTKLYSANLVARTVRRFVGIASLRPDWCWRRASGRPLTSGPVAFSNDDGIYRVNGDGSNLMLLPKTEGMVYPSWYPDCKYIAADVGQSPEIPHRHHLTAQINALTGAVVAAPLADKYPVWAGFPSVNQVDPRLISFAGQFKGEANYYNELLNYTWVTNRSTSPPKVAPMDREAPAGPGFLQKFQARAGWWSPDGKWFAFESNRVCDNIDGLTYAIFIQDATGAKPAMQVTSCEWDAQHPKWFPPGSTGKRTLLIAAVAKPGGSEPFHIAALDVTAFVDGH